MAACGARCCMWTRPPDASMHRWLNALATTSRVGCSPSIWGKSNRGRAEPAAAAEAGAAVAEAMPHAFHACTYGGKAERALFRCSCCRRVVQEKPVDQAYRGGARAVVSTPRRRSLSSAPWQRQENSARTRKSRAPPLSQWDGASGDARPLPPWSARIRPRSWHLNRTEEGCGVSGQLVASVAVPQAAMALRTEGVEARFAAALVLVACAVSVVARGRKNAGQAFLVVATALVSRSHARLCARRRRATGRQQQRTLAPQSAPLPAPVAAGSPKTERGERMARSMGERANRRIAEPTHRGHASTPGRCRACDRG